MKAIAKPATLRIACSLGNHLWLSLSILLSIVPLTTAQDPKPELVEQTGHSASVDALAFTPDGRWLVSAGHDFSVRLWEVSSGREVRTIGMHSREVNTLVICPIHPCVVSGGNDEVLKLWEIPSGRLLHTFVGHTASVQSASFSKDGRQLISCSGDSPNFEGRKADFSIRIWDVETGKELRKIEGHQKIVTSVDLSQDGTLLLSGSYDGTLKIWDYRTGRLIRTIDGFGGAVRGKFTSGGSQLLSVSSGRVELWDVSTGRNLGVIKQNARPYQIALLPNKAGFAYPSEGTIRLVDLPGGIQSAVLESSPEIVESIAFSVDGRWLASGNVVGAITLWDLTNHQEKRDLSGYVTRLDSMAVSPNGLWVAAGDRDPSIKLWNTQSGRLERSITTESHQIHALAFSKDGSLLASSGVKYSSPNETPVEIWDVASGRRILRILDSSRRVDFLLFSPDGHWLAIGAIEGSVMIWDLRRNYVVRTLSPANKAVAFSATGNWVATGGMDNALTFWELPSGRVLGKYSDIEWGYAVSQDGRWLASTGRRQDFKVWDMASVAASSKYQSPPGTLFSWNSNARRKVHTFHGQGEFVSDVAFSPNGNILATGDWDGKVKLWDPAQGRELRSLIGHTSGVVSVAFGPDGRHLYSAAMDGTIRVWDVSAGEETVALIGARGDNGWLAVAPDGLFDGTSKGMQQVAWRDSGTGDTVALDRFFTDFYYPGLLAEILNGNRPRAQLDIGTEVQIPGLRSMLKQKLAHLEVQSDRVVVCFDQMPGAAMNVAPYDERTVYPHVNGYESGTSSTCKFKKPLRTTNSASTIRRLQNTLPQSITTPWDGVSSDTFHSTLHVLTVGVSNYPNDSGFASLTYAVPSAKAIEEFFRRQQTSVATPYAAVKVWTGLYDVDATRENLEKRFSEMAKEVKADDVVFLYMAGHGMVPLGEEMFYFIPFDGRDVEGKNNDDLRDTGLSTAMIAEALRSFPARRIILIVDSCQSGGAIEALSKIGIVKAQVEERREQLASGSSGLGRGAGVHLIAAALPLSYAVGLNGGQSVLAETILKALGQTSGVITASQLSTIVREQLPVFSEQVTHGFRQVPLTSSIGLDFALSGSKSTRKPYTKSPD